MSDEPADELVAEPADEHVAATLVCGALGVREADVACDVEFVVFASETAAVAAEGSPLIDRGLDSCDAIFRPPPPPPSLPLRFCF